MLKGIWATAPKYKSDRRKYNFDADFANNTDKKYVSGV